MVSDEVLMRVESDLALGHTFVAIQRLTTLVQANPKELELRAFLARVHLATGNWVEAGRWSYLEKDRDPKALAAFERAVPHPRARLNALHWMPEPGADPPAVTDTISALEDQAQKAATGRRRDRQMAAARGSRRDRLVAAGLISFVIANLAVYILGLVALARAVT